MNKDQLEKNYPDLIKYYEEGDCCSNILKARKEIERLNNIINEFEKDVENRLMSIPDDMCDDALEEIKRTTKIAVYQVVLGKLQELKGFK